MSKKVREFMTHREPPEHIWMEREESAVIGTARMGQRMIPKIRPFDLLRSTPLSGNRARAVVFEGDSLRIATEYIAGREAQLTRAADHDVIYLQFSGRSSIESESGIVEIIPGEIALVPAVISHRSTGSDECLRVRVATQEFVTEGVDPEKPESRGTGRHAPSNRERRPSEARTRRIRAHGKTGGDALRKPEG